MALLTLLLIIGLCSIFLSWWCLPLGLLLAWLVHEAWFADHIFYSASDDYKYSFPADTECHALQISDGQLHWPDAEQARPDSTLILQVRIKSSWLGRLFDPWIEAGDDRQTFERGASGIRYLDLTGQLEQLRSGLVLKGQHCRLQPAVQLHVFAAPELSGKRMLILAPHADDAELSAFGLYSCMPDTTAIVTLS